MINHPNLLLLHPISADDVVNFHRRGLERRSAQMGAVSVPGGVGLLVAQWWPQFPRQRKATVARRGSPRLRF